MNGSSNLPVLGVKGQDERPLRGALDTPVRHHRTPTHSRPASPLAARQT